MILTLTPATPKPMWSAQLELDYSAKTWQLVGSPTTEWRRITNDTRGTIQIIWRGKDQSEASKGANLWLWDSQPGQKKNTPIILHDTPVSGDDRLHTGSTGRLYAPADKGWQDNTIAWTLGVVLEPTVGSKGNSIRADAIKLITDNIGDRVGIIKDAPNWVEGKAREKDTTVNAQGHRSTGCGGLPGKMFIELEKMGWPIPKDKFDAFDPRYTGRPKTEEEKKKNVYMQLAGFGFGYKFMVQQIEKSRGKVGTMYIDFSKKGKRHPLPGDIYVIAIPKTGIIRHVGVVLECDGKRMKTADGGQGDSGYAVAINEKFYDAKSFITGSLEKGILDGWVDLEALVRE